MAVTLKKIDLWSEKEQKIVPFEIATVDDETSIVEYNPDGSPMFNKVITATYGDEVHRFSPNTTDEELMRIKNPEKEATG